MFALVPVAVLALFVTALVAGARSDSAGGSVLALDRAPAIRLPDVRDPAGSVAFAGTPTRPTVVNFFAAWCVPCREELPYLVAEAKARPGVDFLGIDVRDVRADAVPLLDQTGVTFLTAFDRTGEVARSYGVAGMPATVFIAPGGKVVASHQGPISRSRLRELLDQVEAA